MVRLTPKASCERIDGIAKDGDGKGVLRVAVTAVPENGRANRALIKLLAKQWRLAKSSITIVQGAKDRNKTLLVTGEAKLLLEGLETWTAHTFPAPKIETKEEDTGK